MARSPLILAALAKDAVPQFDFAQVKNLDSGQNGAFDAALLTAKSGEHFVIRMANSPAAGTELEAEIRALKAISTTSRSTLPFSISNLVGNTQDSRGDRALVFDFVYGNPIDISRVSAGSNLAGSIANSIAAIHRLSLETVQNAGFPELGATTLLRQRVAELDRAAQTGKVPPVLLSRWERALEDVSLFKYQPTVIHAAINSQTVLEINGSVSGILSWSSLRISDPAEDLAWVLGGGSSELALDIVRKYAQARVGADANIWTRALLYSELELSRWLIHGYSQGNQEIIEDAVGMLLVLMEEVETGKAERLHPAPLSQTISANNSASEKQRTQRADELF